MDSPAAPFRAAVVTVSDSSAGGKRADLSGPKVAELLRQAGFQVAEQKIVPDEQPAIEAALVELASRVSLVVTTGGTGVAPRDVTPEATRAVCQRLIEGIPEVMRASGVRSTPRAALSRAVCGVRGETLLLNLPGSPAGAAESLAAVLELLPHVLRLLRGQTEHA